MVFVMSASVRKKGNVIKVHMCLSWSVYISWSNKSYEGSARRTYFLNKPGQSDLDMTTAVYNIPSRAILAGATKIFIFVFDTCAIQRVESKVSCLSVFP